MNENQGPPLKDEEREGILTAQRDNLAEILHALSKQDKLMVFQELAKGGSIQEIKDEATVSGSTIHNYVDELDRADLINKSEDYQITDLGSEVLMCILFIAHVKQYKDRQRIFDSQPQLDRTLEEYGEVQSLTFLGEASVAVFDETVFDRFEAIDEDEWEFDVL